ncbi:Long-chain-fatty-acid--CoA ligase [Afipia felis]
MSCDLAHSIGMSCEMHSSRTAISDETEDLSYGDFAKRAGSLVDQLRERQLRKNEPVIVRVSNRAADLVAFQAVWLAGGVVVPLHADTPPAVLAEAISTTGVSLMVDNYRIAPSGQREVAVNPLLRGAALVVLTSGSTGKPKGVVLSHKAFLGKLEAIQSRLSCDHDTQTLLVLQITFSFGIWTSLLTLLHGGHLTMRRKFTPAGVWDAISRGATTDVALVPTMIRALLADRQPIIPCKRLRRLLTGGEPMGMALGEATLKLFPNADVVDVYGLTETSTSDFMSISKVVSGASGAIGRPTPGIEFRIVDAGVDVKPGQPGELQIKTPFIMNGYLNEPGLTEAAFEGAFFKTGDLARQRADGVVELVGRAKEVISRGGNKIAPLELDNLLARHPDVNAALATGVPDDLLGEKIHILILVRSGSKLDEADVREWLSDKLDRYKQPDVLHFGTEIPLNRSGKGDRRVLREKILANAYTGDS